MSELFTAKNAKDLAYGKDHAILVRALERVKEAATAGKKSVSLGASSGLPSMDSNIWWQAAWGSGKPEWHAMKLKLENLGYKVTKEGEDGSRFDPPYTVISWE